MDELHPAANGMSYATFVELGEATRIRRAAFLAAAQASTELQVHENPTPDLSPPTGQLRLVT